MEGALDDVVTQADMQPGDLLFFHGKPNGCLPYLFTPGVMLGQYFLQTSHWPATFAHSAICTENNSGKIRILHLRDVGWNRTEVREDPTRDLSTRPYRNPILIVRPPERMRAEIVTQARRGIHQGITQGIGAYYKAAFGDSLPCKRQHATFFQKGITCVGFLMNVVQFAYQEVEGMDFPISREVASNKAIFHFGNLKENDPHFKDWQILLAPYFPDLTCQLRKQTLMKYLIEYVDAYAESLMDKSTSAESVNKRRAVLDTLAPFRKWSFMTEATQLVRIQELLRRLKPIMEAPRCYFSSWSFYYLQCTIDQLTAGVQIEKSPDRATRWDSAGGEATHSIGNEVGDASFLEHIAPSCVLI